MDFRMQELITQSIMSEITPEARDEIVKLFIRNDLNTSEIERKVKEQAANQIQYWIREKVEQKLKEPETEAKLENIITELITDYLHDKQFIKLWLSKKLLIQSAENIRKNVG